MFVKYLAAIGTHMDEFSKVKLGNVRSTRTCYCLPRVIIGYSYVILGPWSFGPLGSSWVLGITELT